MSFHFARNERRKMEAENLAFNPDELKFNTYSSDISYLRYRIEGPHLLQIIKEINCYSLNIFLIYVSILKRKELNLGLLNMMCAAME
jgi:hypothetical protein